MADVANITDNFTESNINGTGRIPATPEGMAVAYTSLVIMALLPIFFGSYRSVKHHKEQAVRDHNLPNYTILRSLCMILGFMCFPLCSTISYKSIKLTVLG